MTLFRLKDSVQMTFQKPFNYHSGLWLLLSQIILSQTFSKLQNGSIEDSVVDNCLKKEKKKKRFGNLMKDVKPVARFSRSHQFQVGRNYVTQQQQQ